MTTSTTNPALFITDYASYNAGLQFVCGKWYDLTEFDSVDELIEAIQDQYNEVLNDPENKEMKELYIKYNIDFNNISNLELMITDFEGFPDELYSESFDTDLIQKIIDNAELLEKLENLEENDIINLHNQYCDLNSYHDDMIYDFDNSFFDEICGGMDRMEIARASTFGDLNWSDDYICFDGYGNFKSIRNIESEIDLDAIKADILQNPDKYDF